VTYKDSLCKLKQYQDSVFEGWGLSLAEKGRLLKEERGRDFSWKSQPRSLFHFRTEKPANKSAVKKTRTIGFKFQDLSKECQEVWGST
jgi:hypothetical protein